MKLKEYEKFIEKEVKKGNRSKELLEFHEEMVRCFQHERFIHMIIMLFFVFVSLIMLGLTGVTIGNVGGLWVILWPFYLATLIMTGLSIGYVKYYYYLENHVQGLYRYTVVLAGFEKK